MTEYLMIGEVLKPQGLRGECKIRSYAADISLFETWSTVYLCSDGVYSPLSLSFRRIHDGFVYAVLGECRTPEDVERLRGKAVYIDRAHAAPLEEGADYIADLIGCQAVDEEGRNWGELKEVLQHGPVDTWVFSGAKPFMAPALKSVFPEVHTEEKRILVQSGRLEEVAVFED
jgi:16S rRNA processing protein RimM